MWTKTVTSYSNGSPTESSPVCITGSQGSTGDTGTGIDSIIEEYAISSSKIEPPDSFSETRPVWTAGNYIWTRSVITYKNPTSTVPTAPVVSSE